MPSALYSENKGNRGGYSVYITSSTHHCFHLYFTLYLSRGISYTPVLPEVQLKLMQSGSEVPFICTAHDSPAFCYNYNVTCASSCYSQTIYHYSYPFITGMKMSQLIYRAIPRVWVWLHCVVWKPNMRQAALVKCNLYLWEYYLNRLLQTMLFFLNKNLIHLNKKRCTVVCTPHGVVIPHVFALHLIWQWSWLQETPNKILKKKKKINKFGNNDEQLSTNNDCHC